MRTLLTVFILQILLTSGYSQMHVEESISPRFRSNNSLRAGSCASPDGTVTTSTTNCISTSTSFGAGNGGSATFCFTFTAPNSGIDFAIGYTSSCGNNISWTGAALYLDGSCTLIATNDDVFPDPVLTVGANYVYCYTLTKSGGGACSLTEVCPRYSTFPLPITISKLGVENDNKSNIISWTTASELNNQWQIVEKSVDGISNWTEVDRVSGSMSSDGNRSYEVIDHKPFGLTYYRIPMYMTKKQVANDKRLIM